MRGVVTRNRGALVRVSPRCTNGGDVAIISCATPTVKKSAAPTILLPRFACARSDAELYAEMRLAV